MNTINCTSIACNIIITLVIIVIYHNCFYNKQMEHMSSGTINDEALQNLASVYNS